MHRVQKHQQLSVSTASDLCTLLLLTMHMRTVCVKAEQHNAKLNNWTWLNRLVIIRGHKHFLEEGKFIVGGDSVASMHSVSALSNIYGFWEYCSRLLVLPDSYFHV